MEKEIIYYREQYIHRVLGKAARMAWIFDKYCDGKRFGAERTSQGMTCICSGCRRNEQHRTLITEQWNNLERFKRVSVFERNGQNSRTRAFRQECDLKTVSQTRPLSAACRALQHGREAGEGDWPERSMLRSLFKMMLTSEIYNVILCKYFAEDSRCRKA